MAQPADGGTGETPPDSAALTAPWRDQVLDYLEFIFRAMGYLSPETGGMGAEEALAHLVESWATSGMPDDVTQTEAFETLDALADLELLLLTHPEEIPLFLQLESLATIASMREALTANVLAAPTGGGGE